MTPEKQTDSILSDEDKANLEVLRANNKVNRELATRAASKLVFMPDGSIVDKDSVNREINEGRLIEGAYSGGHR